MSQCETLRYGRRCAQTACSRAEVMPHAGCDPFQNQFSGLALVAVRLRLPADDLFFRTVRVFFAGKRTQHRKGPADPDSGSTGERPRLAPGGQGLHARGHDQRRRGPLRRFSGPLRPCRASGGRHPGTVRHRPGRRRREHPIQHPAPLRRGTAPNQRPGSGPTHHHDRPTPSIVHL